MIELLAPSGDFECLKAAVLNGANAVYIGGKEFSARQYAGNFDRDELVEAVRYCHCYGTKVYVTMNTLYSNDELKGAINYAAFLYEIGVDALIIQDIGFVKLLKEQLPDFELHASTQMTVHNLDGVNQLYKMGIKRVVLSRELSFKEIEHIAKNTNAEIEVFIHGALCISFSGQCLFSSMIGGRSGNRGRCAQSCRQKYTFDSDKDGYFLSPKDLSTLEYIYKLKESGVASLKIEGRMKKPEYVSGIVSTYKQALESTGSLIKTDLNIAMNTTIKTVNMDEKESDSKNRGLNNEDESFLSNKGTQLSERKKSNIDRKFLHSDKLELPEEVEASVAAKVHQLFNRGGFTTYNLIKKQGKHMMSYERPGNWGTFVGVIVEAKDKFASIKLESPLNAGDGVENFNRGNGALVSKMWVKGKEVPNAAVNEVTEIYLEKARVGDKIYKSYDADIVKKEEESYKGKEILRVPLVGFFRAAQGEKMSFTIYNRENVEATVFGSVPEVALKTPTSNERVRDALSKTKDTPFYFENIEIETGEELAIPVSEINKLRREAINTLTDKLQNKRCINNSAVEYSAGTDNSTERHETITPTIDIEFKAKGSQEKVTPKLVAITGNFEAAKAAIDGGCDIVFFGGDELRINTGNFSRLLERKNHKTQLYPWFPEILLEDYESKKRASQKYSEDHISTALCGNLGLYSQLNQNNYTSFLSGGFNIFNSYACEVFENSIPMLSAELNLKQLRETIKNTKAETMVLIHGRQKLMVSRHCFVGSIKGHGREGCPNLCDNEIHYLKDKMGENFLVVTDNYCRSHVYNSKILCTIEHFKDIISMNSNYLAISFLDESYEDALLTVNAYKNQLENAMNGNSYLSEEAEALMEKLKGNITKGHFYRGVE